MERPLSTATALAVTCAFVAAAALGGCAASPDAPASSEDEVAAGRRCTVLTVIDIDAMRAWHEVVRGVYVDRDVHVPGLLRSEMRYDPYVRLAVDEVIFLTEDDGTVSATFEGPTAARAYEAMEHARETERGAVTTRESSDGRLVCARFDDAPHRCEWFQIQGIFSLRPAEGRACP